MMTNEKRAYEEWLQLCQQIQSQTNLPVKETEKQKRKRIKRLLDDEIEFWKYYFPHYCKSDFGWFHKKAAKEILADKNALAILEWAREHAKSVFADVFMPLFLKATGEFTGMILVSSNADKANGLLGDIQAELTNNQRYINDFGEQFSHGNWQSGHFKTKDGCGFWAFGRGQNPRGARKADKRPNYAVVDDIDDKVIVKNDTRANDAVEWVFEDLYGCLSIAGGRMIIAGNRIHKKSILARIVGDIEPDDPKREGIIHIKVYALEKGRKHEKAMPDERGARPAWKENHKMEDLLAKIKKMPYRSAMREYFHEHIEEGLIFKNDWIHWVEPLELKKYDAIICYCDPSFKDTGDCKAIVVVGRKGKYYDILKCWIRQDSVKKMVQAHYDFFEEFGNLARYYMEANFIQDLLLRDFDQEAELRCFHVPLRKDKSKKDKKEMRIENMSPLFERGFVRFNKREKGSRDMQTLKSQLLGFGSGIKDDGPDALEGGISKMPKRKRGGKGNYRSGKYNSSSRKW